MTDEPASADEPGRSGEAHGERRLTARVTGVVQGVGFRAFVQREGRRLDLAGYVRNRADGSVEVAAEGPEPRLRELHAALRNGPPGARVERVEAEYAGAAAEFHGFSVRY